MLDNKQISNCDFAEELVSYLYGEISVSEKLRFENHLTNCSVCREELAGFSLARNAVQEWKTIEFKPLQNPAIEIPYPPKAEIISRSWFAVIHEYFTLSPAWATASTALAALTICAGLLAILIGSNRNNVDFAEVEKEVKVISSPTNGNQNQNSNVSNSNQNKQKPNNSSESPNITGNPKSDKTQVEPTKITAKPNVSAPQTIPVKTVQPKTKTVVKQPLKTKNQKAPSFLDEDEEQDSLTLTDLLEEIGSDDKDD